jgi:phosphohistidine phosphatase
MKTLYLLRHAKSSWGDPGLKDFDRPLNKRGLKASPRVGAQMLKEKIRPDLVLSSPALRAKQTTTMVCEAAGFSSLINFDERIYEAGVQRLFEIVTGFEDSINTAMMVGHNPGFEELLSALTGESQRMQTAALACIELKIKKWSDLTGGAGKLVWLIKAKELP